MKCLFQSYRVDILWEGETLRVLGQQVVQRMATDGEAVADVLALQANISIETFGANSRVDGMEENTFLFVFPCWRILLFINHADEGTVLLGDDALLIEEIKGKGQHSQQDDNKEYINKV